MTEDVVLTSGICWICARVGVLTGAPMFGQFALGDAPVLTPTGHAYLESPDGPRIVPMTDVVPGVCTNCQQGWMTRLDEAALPLVSDLLMRHTVAAIPLGLATGFAAWAVKTALLKLVRDEYVSPAWAAEQARSLRSELQAVPGPMWEVLIGSIEDGGSASEPEPELCRRLTWELALRGSR